MEKAEKKLFYLGIEEASVAMSPFTALRKRLVCEENTQIQEMCDTTRKLRKHGSTVRSLERKLNIPGGSLCIYYALLPEYAGRGLFLRKGKPWKQKYLEEVAEKTIYRAENTQDCREIVVTPKLAGSDVTAPIELWAACLHTFAPFEKVCVSFSKEGGTFEARQAVLLLVPYLKRMREVVFVGEESSASRLLADYLYYEYGLVMTPKTRVPDKMIWLDFGQSDENIGCFCQKQGSIWRINNAGTLKFLDTAVKNGYNTES